MVVRKKKKKLIEWRRAQVLESVSKGHTQKEIADILHVCDATICKDLEYLKEQSKENIKKYVDEKLPNEYEKCLVGLTAILREAWTTSEEALDRREKIQALSLAKDCYSMKLELLTNATVVDDAIRFVSRKSEDNEKIRSAIEGEKEAKEHDYDEDQLEDQEEKTGETTVNHIF